jgi:phosphate transport system substrate-binding protein
VVVEKGDKLSADGFAELLEGRAQIVTFVREAFPAELAAFRQKFGYPLTLVAVGGGSVATKSGTHAIAIYVNAANPLSRLSLRQLDGIFSAERRRGSEALTRWGQLGLTGEWADRPIRPCGMLQKRTTGNPPGIVNFVQRTLLLDAPFAPGVSEVVDRAGVPALDGIVHQVAGDRGAIGYSGFAYAAPGAKTVAVAEGDFGPAFSGTAAEVADRRYPLSRQIYLGVNRRTEHPDPLTDEFLHYVLSPEGQAGMAKNRMNFLPLSPAQAQAESRVSLPSLSTPPTFPIIGYNDMAGIVAGCDELYARDHPSTVFTLALKGTRTAPLALASGQSLLAPMGAEFSDAELAQYRALAGSEPVALRVAHASLNPVALSGPIGIYVARDNPLHSLTVGQVNAVFTRGRSMVWGDLGLTGEWAARPIEPIGLGRNTALGIYMQRKALAAPNGIGNTQAQPGEHDRGPQASVPYTESSQLLAPPPHGRDLMGLLQSAAVVAAVGQHPFSIGFASANRVTPRVKLLSIAPAANAAPVECTAANVQAGRYPYDRFLFIYLRRNHAGAIEPAAAAYVRLMLSPSGQNAIAAAQPGYLPLDPAEITQQLARLNALMR